MHKETPPHRCSLWHPNREALIPSGIVIFALALRLTLLSRDGLWADECHTVFLARIPLSDLIPMVRDETQTPGFILLIKAIIAGFGESQFVMRLPSVLFGTLAVVASWFAAKRLLSPALAPIAAFLMAVSPMAVHYSQEARAYGLLQLLVLCGLLLAIRVRDQWNLRNAASLVALFLAILYTHNIGLFFVFGIAAGCVVAGDNSTLVLRRWAVIALATFAGYLPWLYHLFLQLTQISTMYTWASDNWGSEFPWQVPRSLAALTHGALTPVRNRAADLPAPAWIALIFCLLLAIAAFAARQKLVRSQAPLLLLTALLVPLAGQFLYCWIADTPSYTVGRNDAPALPFLILLMTAGCVAIVPRLRWLVPVACAGLAFQPLLVHYSFDFRSQEYNLAKHVNSIRKPDEVIITTSYHYSVSCFVDSRFGEIHLLYPSQLESHPSWADWSSFDRAAATQDAEAVIRKAIDVSQRYGQDRIWLLRHLPTESAGVLVDIANERLELVTVTYAPDVYGELYEYLVPG